MTKSEAIMEPPKRGTASRVLRGLYAAESKFQTALLALRGESAHRIIIVSLGVCFLASQRASRIHPVQSMPKY